MTVGTHEPLFLKRENYKFLAGLDSHRLGVSIELQPSQLLRAAISRNRDLGRGWCWNTLGPAWSPLSSAQWRRGGSPSQEEAFASQALSVCWVCTCHVCVCVCVGGAGLTHETPAAVRHVIFYTCLGANVDSLTNWVSHTFENKRPPSRITIDPGGTLSCIWKERESEREYATSSLSLSVCLLQTVMSRVLKKWGLKDHLGKHLTVSVTNRC